MSKSIYMASLFFTAPSSPPLVVVCPHRKYRYGTCAALTCRQSCAPSCAHRVPHCYVKIHRVPSCAIVCPSCAHRVDHRVPHCYVSPSCALTCRQSFLSYRNETHKPYQKVNSYGLIVFYGPLFPPFVAWTHFKVTPYFV